MILFVVVYRCKIERLAPQLMMPRSCLSTTIGDGGENGDGWWLIWRCPQFYVMGCSQTLTARRARNLVTNIPFFYHAY
jgi:hypothetical protein